MANEWYRRLENQIIGTIDKKKRKERKGESKCLNVKQQNEN